MKNSLRSKIVLEWVGQSYRYEVLLLKYMADKKINFRNKTFKNHLQKFHLNTAFDTPEQDHIITFSFVVKQHYQMSYEPKEFCRFCTWQTSFSTLCSIFKTTISWMLLKYRKPVKSRKIYYHYHCQIKKNLGNYSSPVLQLI